MDADRKKRLEVRARVLKALGHPSRLAIVEELGQGERCVAELTDLVGSDMSTVSKHLSQLRSAGLVHDRRQGAQVYYRLAVPCVLDFFSCVESVLQNQVQTQIFLVQ
jgi:ArsR family transcriptional regulator